MKDNYFATSFSDLFRRVINYEFTDRSSSSNITFYQRKHLLYERIRDHITNMMRSDFVFELLRIPPRDIRYSLEISVLFKTQNTDRRMFGASTSYQISMVLQLVDVRG